MVTNLRKTSSSHIFLSQPHFYTKEGFLGAQFECDGGLIFKTTRTGSLRPLVGPKHLEMILEGSDSAETSPPLRGGIGSHLALVGVGGCG